MQFNGISYFAFLIFALVTAMPMKFRLQNIWLVLLSYAFYAFWDWRFCSLMLTATLLGYVPALKIEQYFEANPELSKRWMQFSIIGCLGILGVFKYFDFFLTTLSLKPLGIILPAGISFYLFHTISYVVDVYRKHVPASKDFVEVALFLAFFPQLVAGPIARSSSLLPQCQKPRIVTADMVHRGLFLILLGLFRKVVIADTAGAMADPVFNDPSGRNTWELLLATFWYSVQIYSDFSGYSDMARGSALLFGFNLTLNFNHPYISQNMSEFWTRWHISLSSWLRDYLYIPLGGNRKGVFRTYVNLMITMLLGGLWHGASWNFVLWGLIHGIALVILQGYKSRVKSPPQGRLIAVLNTALVLVVVGLAWIPFRCNSFTDSLTFLRGLFAFDFRGYVFLLPAVVVLVFVALVDLPQIFGKGETRALEWKLFPRLSYLFLMIMLVVLSGDLRGAAFIYFQF
jgi:alginate O-acetyltransferase complex protein AlgI